MRWQFEVVRDLGFTAVLHFVYYGVPYIVYRFGTQRRQREASSITNISTESLCVVGGAVLAYGSAPVLLGFFERFPPIIRLMVTLH